MTRAVHRDSSLFCTEAEQTSQEGQTHLAGDNEEKEHVGQDVREALVQEPRSKPSVWLRAHQWSPSSAPHYQEIATQQPRLPIIAPRHRLCTH